MNLARHVGPTISTVAAPHRILFNALVSSRVAASIARGLTWARLATDGSWSIGAVRPLTGGITGFVTALDMHDSKGRTRRVVLKLYRPDIGPQAADGLLDADRAIRVESPPHNPHWDIVDAMSWRIDPVRHGVARARRYESFIAAAVAAIEEGNRRQVITSPSPAHEGPGTSP